jgi:hypothetical protein
MTTVRRARRRSPAAGPSKAKDPAEIAALREAIFEHTHRMEEPLREAACFVRLIGMLGLQDDEAHEPVATVAMAAWRKLKDVSEAWETLCDLALPSEPV